MATSRSKAEGAPVTVDAPEVHAAIAAGARAALTPEEVEDAGYFGVSVDTTDPDFYTLAGEAKRRERFAAKGSAPDARVPAPAQE